MVRPIGAPKRQSAAPWWVFPYTVVPHPVSIVAAARGPLSDVPCCIQFTAREERRLPAKKYNDALEDAMRRWTAGPALAAVGGVFEHDAAGAVPLLRPCTRLFSVSGEGDSYTPHNYHSRESDDMLAALADAPGSNSAQIDLRGDGVTAAVTGWTPVAVTWDQRVPPFVSNVEAGTMTAAAVARFVGMHIDHVFYGVRACADIGQWALLGVYAGEVLTSPQLAYRYPTRPGAFVVRCDPGCGFDVYIDAQYFGNVFRDIRPADDANLVNVRLETAPPRTEGNETRYRPVVFVRATRAIRRGDILYAEFHRDVVGARADRFRAIGDAVAAAAAGARQARHAHAGGGVVAPLGGRGRYPYILKDRRGKVVHVHAERALQLSGWEAYIRSTLSHRKKLVDGLLDRSEYEPCPTLYTRVGSLPGRQVWSFLVGNKSGADADADAAARRRKRRVVAETDSEDSLDRGAGAGAGAGDAAQPLVATEKELAEIPNIAPDTAVVVVDRSATARRDIPRGTVLGVYTGEVLTSVELYYRYPRQLGHYVVRLDGVGGAGGIGTIYIDATRSANPLKYVQHCAVAPNVFLSLFAFTAGPHVAPILYVTAMRNIAKGEHVYANFGNEVGLPKNAAAVPKYEAGAYGGVSTAAEDIAVQDFFL